MPGLANTPLAAPLFWAGFGLCLPQALTVRRRATRLPPADGPTFGRVGDGTPLRLIGIGDSIIDGVGVHDASRALTGRLAACWARATGHAVGWSALGRNGIDASGALRRLVPRLPDAPVDCVLVSIGVNDVTRLKTVARWRADLAALLKALAAHSPEAVIILLAVPPLARFPALPWPLSAVLCLRGEMFNRAGRAVVEEHANDGTARVEFVDYQEFGTLTPDGFASDGYHPNEATCAAIAPLLAARIGKLVESGEAVEAMIGDRCGNAEVVSTPR